MNKQRKTSHILNVFQYDPTTGAVTLPASLALVAPDSSDNSTKVATTAWIRAYVGSLSYATASSVETAIANLVASAPTTLNTLNELATALGNDPNFATTITTSIGTKVPQSRTITINGTTYDLSANRSWTIATYSLPVATASVLGGVKIGAGVSVDAGGVISVSTNYQAPLGGTGFVKSTAGVISYDTSTYYLASNPSGYITSSGTAAAVSQTVAAASEANLVYAAIADNDFFRIRVGGSSNAGWAEIATADDGTEPIYVRQYTGTFTTVTRTATLLDGSGNTSFPGALSAGGNISGNYILGSYFNSSAGNSENPTIGQVWTQSTGDNYLRKSTPAHFISQLGLITTSNIGSQTVLGLNAQFLGTGSMNVSYGYTTVLRNENGSGGAVTYAPLLHMSASDTMWQLQGTYGTSGNGTLYFRQGYAGNWGNWLTMLSSANYNSYSPTLTGGGASGTWGISISGNAATATSAGSTGSLDGYTWGSAGKMVRGSDFYTDGWFRNYNNNQGLYNQNNGNHFYSNSGGSWGITGAGGNVELQFYSNHQSSLRGYVYGDTSSNFGLLNNQGGWSVRCNPGTGYGGTLSGEWVMTGPFTANGAIRVNANDNLYLDYNYGCSIVGVYTSTRYQGIFAMGNSYKLPIDGSSTGSLYGLAWSHPNAGGVASNLNTHGLLVMENGTFLAAISGSIRARDDMRAPIFYDSNDTTYYCDPTGNSRLVSLNIGYTSGTTYNTGASGKIYFNSHGESDINGYSIGTTVVSMNGYSYTKLDLSWHTGIRIGAYSLYGGTRFYNNSPAYYDGGEVMSIASGDNHIRINYDLYVGYGRGSSNIFMYDSDETSRRIHCNSNRIGFLNSSDGWGAWCNNDGSFQSARKVQGEYLYSDGWIYSSGGNTGWLQDNQNQGIRAAGYNSYFGTIATYGTNSNGYGGYTIMNNYRVILMQNSSGDFGFYNNDDWAWQLFYNRSNNCWGIGTDNTYSGDGFRCVKYGSSQYGWTTWSDRRAKENITSITGALDKVLNMRGVYFNYINDDAKTQRVGFIAQELEEVLPQAVRYAEEIDEYNVEYAQIVSVLTEAIKEQNVKITRLEALVEQLTNN
jgi:hypothetical protein